MALFSRTLMAGVALATFGIALPATANLYQDQNLPEYAGADEEPGQSIEVILSAPDDASAQANTSLPPVDMRDFDIEDFIGADGQIDLDKLRAYEDAQLGIAMREMSPETSYSNAETGPQKIEDAEIFVWTEDGFETLQSPGEDVFIHETETQTSLSMDQNAQSPDASDLWDTPTTYDSRHIYEDIQREAEIEPVWGEPSAEEAEAESLSAARSRTRSAVARIEKLLGTLRGETVKPDHGHNQGINEDHDLDVMTIDLRPAPNSNAARTISLSGETQIVIGEDGTITITNNGQSVIPLAMAAGASGKAAAMVMDDNAPAKITVSKTIKVDNGKRHVHVEVDMESDVESAGSDDAWNSHN